MTSFAEQGKDFLRRYGMIIIPDDQNGSGYRAETMDGLWSAHFPSEDEAIHAALEQLWPKPGPTWVVMD